MLEEILLTNKNNKNLPLEIDLSLCKACRICYTLCPTKAIVSGEHGEVVLESPEKCIKCGICEEHCPDFVITVRRDK